MKIGKTKKMAAIVIGLFMVVSLSAIVFADTENITVTWVVSADTTITASYPTAEGKIEFSATSGDFDDLGASSQTSATAALRIQNDGNTAVALYMNFTNDWPSGVSFVNMSVNDNSNTSGQLFWWTDDNETNNQTVVASLAATGSDTEDFWFWSDGSAVAETAGEDRILRVNSQNV